MDSNTLDVEPKQQPDLPIKVHFVTFGPWYEGVGADLSGGSHAAQHGCKHAERQQSRHLPVDLRGEPKFLPVAHGVDPEWTTKQKSLVSAFNEVQRSCAALMSLSTADWLPSLNCTHSAPRTLTSCLQTLISFLSLCQNKTDRTPAFLHLFFPLLLGMCGVTRHPPSVSTNLCSNLQRYYWIKLH